jgi:hypothetical protein
MDRQANVRCVDLLCCACCCEEGGMYY